MPGAGGALAVGGGGGGGVDESNDGIHDGVEHPAATNDRSASGINAVRGMVGLP
jgi:hypothetical protein